MTTNVWNIVWRDRATGNIIETAGVDYRSWDEADSALGTLMGFRRSLVPTIERRVIVPEPTYSNRYGIED